MSEDLAADTLAAALGARPLRTYPAIVSTEADAMAWARAGGPHGALVVADYQAAPRGRGGLPWQVEQGRGLGCSVVLRPSLGAQREGWLYVVAGAALADVTGARSTIAWPDEVWDGDRRAAAAGVQADLESPNPWAVLTVLVTDAAPPRGPALAALVAALDDRLAEPPDRLLAGYRSRCRTIGERVRARMIPLGPAGTVVEGKAVDVLDDGALVIATDDGRRVAVPPQSLGLLEPAEASSD